MRRSERELGFASVVSLLERCTVLRLAMIDGSTPYIVPLNYGFECSDGKIRLYFHSAAEGRKLDILRRNPRVCFELDADYEIQPHELACKYSNLYSSVIGTGTVRFLSGEEKKHALSVLMKHLSGRDFTFTDDEVSKLEVLSVEVGSISGKANRV